MPESLKLPTPTPPPPVGVRWIDVATAAGRMNLSERRVRQLCGERWLAMGLARVEMDNGRSGWVIREDADPALSRIKFADQLDYSSNELTGAQRQALNERLAILKGWERHIAQCFRHGKSKGQATDEYLAIVRETRGQRVTKTTLYDWQSRYQSGGVAALVDGRWKPAGKVDRQNDPFLEQLKFFFLDLRRPKLSVCHEMTMRLAAERGWPVHSYPACHRYVKTIPLAILKLKRFGAEAYTNDAEPYLERDYSTVASNEIWCGDHHQFDLWVNVDAGRLVRPWLTAWQDMRSRKIVGYVIIAHDPNQHSILEAFRRGVLDCGVPGKLYIDNGKDYDSYALNGETKKTRLSRRRIGEFDYAAAQGIFARLGAGTIHCQPYHGQSKPIERFFGTLESRFCPTFESYCGNKPENRPENLGDKLARGKAPMLSEFVEAFDAWLAADYHGRPHTGDGVDGMTPDAAFAANLHRKKTATKEVLDTLLMPRTKPVKVTQNGVLYKGIRYGQYAPALVVWQGKTVVLAVDGRDLSFVHAYSEAGVYIDALPSNRRIPANATDAELRDAMKEKRRHRKVQKEFYETRPRLHEDTTDLLISAALAKNAARPPEAPIDPPSLVPLRTEIEGQLPHIRRCIEAQQPLRKAAGAEGMSGRDAFRQLGAALNAADRDEEWPHPLDVLAASMERRGVYASRIEEIEDPFEVLRERNSWGGDEPDAARDPFSLLVDWNNQQEQQDDAMDPASDAREAHAPFINEPEEVP